MSVQAGIWNLNGKPIDKNLLAGISQAIAEYGPDGEETYFEGSVGMLYRPFHTTFESRIERQPQVSPDGKAITWDGRLDNRDELISDLRIDLTPGKTDVAIVAEAFARWGTSCFAKLVGDWAMAIWDRQEKTLILARDYVGVRQLYYNLADKRCIWCTHLAPLALWCGPLTLNEEYIAGYLALYPDAHVTPYREIHSVPPANFVRIHNGKPSIGSYWKLNSGSKVRYKTDREYEEHFRHVFRKAVHRRLRTDSPILAELSGGFDSSSIVCMADEIVGEEATERPRIDTFSIYDSKEPAEDDFHYFTKVEEMRGRKGFHADLATSDVSFAIANRDFSATPGFGDREGLKAKRLAILHEGNYRVGLSGLGGDEMLGQSLDPRVQMADLILDLRFGELAKQLTAWSLLIRRPWLQLFFQTIELFLPTTMRARIAPVAKVEPWISSTFARRHQLSARVLGNRGGSWICRPSVRDSLETVMTLARQMTFARPSVIEKRYPYLDQDLVEFLTSIPTTQLLRPGQRRSLMRRSLSNLLPPEIVTRRTKAAAGRCHVVTLEKHWSNLEDILRSPLASRLGYLNEAQYHAALTSAKNGNLSPYFVRLLRALSLELWLRDVVARGVILMENAVPRTVGTDFVQART